MRPAIKSLALAAATLIVGLASLPSLTGQSRTPAIPRLNGKPDLNGIWQTLNTANWDIQTHSANAALAMRPGPVVLVPSKEVLCRGERVTNPARRSDNARSVDLPPPLIATIVSS